MGHRQQQFTKIVLDVAGPWAAREDVVAAIAARAPGWKYAGRLLVHTASHRTFHLDVVDRDAALGATAALGFRYESPEDRAGAVVTPSLRLTAPGGTFEMARLALDAVAALVQAGGSAVACRSSGGSLAGAEIATLAAETGGRPLLRAFVAEHAGADERFTSGMQSLGLADAVAAGDAHALLARFTTELVDGAVRPKAGARFADARLAHEATVDVPREDPRFNPFGRWRLTPWMN